MPGLRKGPAMTTVEHFTTVAAGILAAVVTGQPVTDPRRDPTMPDLLTERWYVHPNDLIGGWAVLNRDCPPSQLNRHTDPDAREVGDFLTEQVARHIVELHNATLAAVAR